MAYLLQVGIVTISLLSTIIGTEAFWMTRNKAQIPQTLDFHLFMNILQPVVETVQNMCKKTRMNFNVGEAVATTRCCIDMELIPKIRGMSPASILRLNSTLYLFQHMDQLRRLTFVREELEAICNIGPTLYKCYIVGFRKGTMCLGMGTIAFEFIEMYLQSICPSQNKIRAMLDPKYATCFQTYFEIAQNCLKYDARSCGMVECLRRTFKPCGNAEIMDQMVALLERMDIDAGCKRMEYIHYRNMAMVEQIHNRKPPMIVDTPAGRVIYRTNQIDRPLMEPCFHKEIEHFVFDPRMESGSDFFGKLDRLCARWRNDTADCHRSQDSLQWTKFMASQCPKLSNSNDVEATVEKCMFSSIPLQISQVEEYCRLEWSSEQVPHLGALNCAHLTQSLMSEFYEHQSRAMCEPSMSIKTLADNNRKRCSTIQPTFFGQPEYQQRSGVLVFVPVN